MKEWKKAVIAPDNTLHDAIRAIDDSAIQTAFVVDEDQRLLGTLSDGDIRRAILRNLSLETRVREVMNPTPTIARAGDQRDSILVTMKLTGHRYIPILDQEGRLTDVAVLDDMIEPEALENWIVIMAGGLGTRLRPLTEECPKPLLPVGDKPILETILETCRNHGFRNFFLSINYKAEMIQEYFGDGSRWGINIEYLKEEKQLGTAGALSILPTVPTQPLVVMNGDILTKINFLHLLDFHRRHQAQATMCVREFHHQVPYGVVDVHEHRINRITEKPTHRYLVNAGIYVLEPETIRLIPRNTAFDMPALFNWLVERGLTTCAFPVREYWIDIGQFPDFQRARGEYQEVFAA